MCLAVPGRVVGIGERDGTPMARVDFGGVVKDVCLACLPEIEVGEYAIVHVGFAIQRLDEESALATLRLFEEIGALDEEFADAWARAAAEAESPPEEENR
ncbi:HypC/HybG/HupF family hydrogenase formation chaperone [Streptomyces sp. SRF1]|uniref:HypC/HybG/HupF family hydrogenase formation chaperone n=1 Tax=Streptomyces sp. SRF1 TaxID=1549642 RepID=UPI0025AEE3FA|nr:HypC/HybG/HupF family hydrogenase formation chaperone [Streptomyces sp. SRF1]MDN3058154.1 HypC/HybG/HupF family hydrogenase formation chaperone [Streptomyces sp. SRF1]